MSGNRNASIIRWSLLCGVLFGVLLMQAALLLHFRSQEDQSRQEQVRSEASIRKLDIGSAEPDRLEAYIAALAEGLPPRPSVVADPVQKAAIAMNLARTMESKGMSANAARSSASKIAGDPFAVEMLTQMLSWRGISLESVSPMDDDGLAPCWVLNLSCAPSVLDRIMEGFNRSSLSCALEGVDLRNMPDGRTLARLCVRTQATEEGVE